MKISDKKYFSEGLEIVVARSLDEIEAIRPIWEEMQAKEPYPVINADIDRYLSVLESQKDEDIKPYIILLKHGNHPKAMVIGRVENHQLCCRVGYKTVYRPLVRCFTIVYGGILGEQNEGVCAKIVAELQSVLRSRQVDMVYISHLKTHSPVYHFARTTPNFLCRGHFPEVQPHWAMSIPKSMELFYEARSKRHRGNLKRYIRKLEKEYPGQAEMVTYLREDELENAVRDASEISSKTYQSAIDKGLVYDLHTLALMKTSSEHRWLRAHILYVNNQPCAFQIGLQYQRTYFLDQIGYDPDWGQYNVGTILFLKVLENLCGDSQVDSIDFGFGDADYKQQNGNKKWDEVSLYVFAPRLYPICVNMLQSAFTGLYLGVNRIGDKLNFTKWIKRHWRNLLQKDAKQ